MSQKYQSLFAGIAGVAFAGVVTPALAAPSCTVWPNTMAAPDLKVAVAANFFGPAKDLVTAWTAIGEPGAGKNVNICQDSTGVLNTEIRAGSSGYSLFLAADDTTPDALVGTGFVQSGATSDLYANGIPVLIALQTTVGDVQTLMPSVSSGVSATLSSQMTTSTPLSVANSQNIAVADPTPAPYGDAAYMIMHDMGLWPTKGTVPTGVHSPLYGNITLTFNSVTDTTNKSGFVSKSQICAGIAPHHASPPDYIYIAFTHSSYMRVQKGILIDSGDGTQNALGRIDIQDSQAV